MLVYGLDARMPYIMIPTGKLDVATLRWRVTDLYNMDTGSSVPVGFSAREWSQEHLIYQNKFSQGNRSVGILSMVQLQFLKPGMFLQKIWASVNQYFLIKLFHQKTSKPL